MLRTTFLLIPALAFAMPFAASTASARPLVSADQPATFCDDDCDDDDDGDGDHDVEINFCLELQVSIDNGACFGEGGPSCIDSCSQAAADTCGQQVGTRAYESCTARLTRSCNRACHNTVAALCQPRWDDDDHDDDDNDDHDDSDVFVEIEFCFELQLDN